MRCKLIEAIEVLKQQVPPVGKLLEDNYLDDGTEWLHYTVTIDIKRQGENVEVMIDHLPLADIYFYPDCWTGYSVVVIGNYKVLIFPDKCRVDFEVRPLPSAQ